MRSILSMAGCWLTWEGHWTWRWIYDQRERAPCEQVKSTFVFVLDDVFSNFPAKPRFTFWAATSQVYINTKRYGNFQLWRICCWNSEGICSIFVLFDDCFLAIRRSCWYLVPNEGCLGWCRFSSCCNCSFCSSGGAIAAKNNYIDKVCWRGTSYAFHILPLIWVWQPYLSNVT